LYLRHFKRLAYLIAACLLSTFCASVDRGRTRATLSFDGEYGFPGDRDYGCDGEVLNTQRHHQIGGKATLRVETREWLIVQVDLGGLYGKLDRSQNIEVSHREYFIGLVGLKVGRNWKNAGFDFGGGVLFSEDGDTALVPRLEFRLGRLGQVWFETGIGPVHAPFDGRAGYAGIGTDGGWYRFHAGGALVRRLLLSPESGNLVGGSIESEGFDAGFYGLFSFEMAKGFFLNLGGVGSSAYSFQLGLGFEL
jgi:hypothetical protein